MARWLRRLGRLAFRRGVERDMDEELRLHLELEIADRVARGMPADAARRSALAEFGGVEHTKEAARDARGFRFLDDLTRDIRYAQRALGRTPVFTLAAVATIALGVGATAVVVSAVQSLVVRPLPVTDPARLVVYSERWAQGPGYVSTSVTYPMYRYDHFLAVRAAAPHLFDELAGFHYAALAFRGGEYAEMLSGMAVSPNFFRALGLRPEAGRFFSDERDPAHATEIVISNALWTRRFARDTGVLGRVLHVNSRPLTVVGVAPAGFNGVVRGLAVDAWVPAEARPVMTAAGSAGAVGAGGGANVTIFGRIRGDYTPAQAEAALSPIVVGVPPMEPWIRPTGARLTPFTAIPAAGRAGVKAFVGLLSAAATLMLLLTGANVAGMLLARATHRRREIAVRLAIGAGRWRVMRQLLTESLALGLAGASLGVLGAQVLLGAVSGWIGRLSLPGSTTPALDLHVDPVALVVSVAVALGVAVLTGLVPALDAARVDVLPALRGFDEARAGRAGRMRRGFVIAQVGLSLALLATAGLFTRALQRALSVDPGFEPEGVVVAGINLGNHGYSTAQGRELFDRLVGRLGSRSELVAVSLGRQTPLGGSHNGEIMLPADRTDDGAPRVQMTFAAVDSAYFSTVRTPIVEGRGFSSRDAPGASPVIILNETAARRLWPDGGPGVGRRVRMQAGTTEYEVVGITRNGRYRNLDEEPIAFAFLPLAQRYAPAVQVFARTRIEPAAAIALLRQELAALDPNIALERARPLASDVDLWRIPQRIASGLIGAFGLTGLLLAAIGIYGVLAYHVARRVREFGIRLALGASAPALTGSVLREGFVMVVPGALLGLALALALAKPMARFLYGVDAMDPVTLGAVVAILTIAALLASYVPARRAARVDPMISLRAE